MIPGNNHLDLLQRSGIRRFTNLAKLVPDCVMLTLGEPDLPTPEPVKAAAKAALDQNLTHYAPNQGYGPLIQAVAEQEQVEPQRVLITVGATGALYTGLTGILNPGDEVIVPQPAYSLYESITLATGGRVVKLQTDARFQISPQALEAAITERTKAIVLTSPNNPTGTVYTAETLQAVKQAVLGRDIYLICDNVYNRLAYGPCPDLSHDPQLQQQVLLCQSFSKPWAMTGWRVGYLIGPAQLMERLLIFHAAQAAAVPTFLQAACVQALKTPTEPMRELYRQRRDYVLQRLEQMGLRYVKPEGAFYVFVDISPLGMGSEELCTRLIRQARVALVPGSCFGCDDHVRISYCCAMEALEKGLDRLENFLDMIRNQGVR